MTCPVLSLFTPAVLNDPSHSGSFYRVLNSGYHQSMSSFSSGTLLSSSVLESVFSFCLAYSETVRQYVSERADSCLLRFMEMTLLCRLLALAHGTGNIGHGVCCCYPRLRTHWDDQQLPHPDQVRSSWSFLLNHTWSLTVKSLF